MQKVYIVILGLLLLTGCTSLHEDKQEEFLINAEQESNISIKFNTNPYVYIPEGDFQIIGIEGGEHMESGYIILRYYGGWKQVKFFDSKSNVSNYIKSECNDVRDLDIINKWCYNITN
jgi:hypothetical protein